jgi:YesN/AraC family two-component response regulator
LGHFKSNLKKFAVVLSDVRMPSMSGIKLMAKIKDLEPAVNAIFMTVFDADHVKSDLEKYNYKVAEIFQKLLLMKDHQKD